MQFSDSSDNSLPQQSIIPRIAEVNKIPIYHIIGAWRSGTTLLSSILDSHPELISTHESPFVMRAYARFSKVPVWKEKDVMSFFKVVMQDKYLATVWSIDREVLKKSLLDYVGLKKSTSLADLCKIVYLHYHSINPKTEIKGIVDKNPIYSLWSENLMKIYPETKFIALVRDYRDNLISRKKYKFHSFQSNSIYAEWWNKVNHEIISLRAAYPEKVLIINYENLVTNPMEEVSRIANFLELKFKEEMLEFNRNFETNAEQYLSNLKEGLQDRSPEFQSTRMAMGANLFNPINNSRVGVWEKTLSRKEIELIEYICGDVGEALGYSKSSGNRRGINLAIKKLLSRLYVEMSSRIHLYRLKNGSA